MAFASAFSPHRDALSEINTTPLIDVMLVILIVLILTIPSGTHSLDIPLPSEGPILPMTPDRLKNKVMLTREGVILWNGDAVSQGQLLGLLHETRRFPTEPELQFEPEAEASYDLAAKVLNIIKGSGVTRFGFVGNERHRVFGKT